MNNQATTKIETAAPERFASNAGLGESPVGYKDVSGQYTSRPKARRARQVWDLVTNKRSKEPISLRFNANCWGSARVCGNAWGWWVADYGYGKYKPECEYVDPKSLA